MADILTDSYKYTHPLLYPPDTSEVYSYMEARVPSTEKVMHFGLQYYLKNYLSTPSDGKFFNVERTQRFHKAHFGFEADPCVIASMKQINSMGFLPVEIGSLPEGLLVPGGVPTMYVRNTQAHAKWLTNHIETLLMKVWYPSTVGTVSANCRKIFKKYLEKTRDLANLPFMLQDFGYRGASSEESAGIGGMAHLVNFMGTDTVKGIYFAEDYYNCTQMPGFSVAASEHTCTIAWGKANEAAMYENAMDQYPNSILSLVADSYDVDNAIDHIFGEQLLEKIKARPANAPLVIRLDSGDPIVGVMKALMKLGQKFGTYQNDKGYTKLRYVKILQGDGVNPKTIELILSNMETFGWAADNIVFGMGGALLQNVNRDTFRYAIKGSNVVIGNESRAICKTVASQPDKASKAGKFFVDKNFKVVTNSNEIEENILKPVFLDGKLLKDWTFDEVRENARQ